MSKNVDAFRNALDKYVFFWGGGDKSAMWSSYFSSGVKGWRGASMSKKTKNFWQYFATVSWHDCHIEATQVSFLDQREVIPQKVIS